MLTSDHVHGDVAGCAHEIMNHGAVYQLEPARSLGFADDDLGDVVCARIGEQLLSNVRTGKGDRLALEFFGEPQRVRDAITLDLFQVLASPGFDIDGRPRRMEAVCEALRVANEPGRARVVADANEQALARRPWTGDRVRPHMRQELLVHALSRAAKSKLPQCRKISGREVVIESALRLLWDVDLALFEPLNELIRRDVDDLDIVGFVEKRVRHRLAHADARDLGHDVVQAFDMLDVESGVDIDTGREQVFDIEVALGVTAAGCIRMGKLIDEHNLWVPLEDGIEVHLFQHVPMIVDLNARNDLEALEQSLRFRASMGFDDADDDIRTLGQLRAGRHQHFVGFADAGSGAYEHLQTAAASIFTLRLFQERVRRRSPYGIGLGHSP